MQRLSNMAVAAIGPSREERERENVPVEKDVLTLSVRFERHGGEVTYSHHDLQAARKILDALMREPMKETPTFERRRIERQWLEWRKLPPRLEVGPDADFFRVEDGGIVDLRRRGTLRAMLTVLVESLESHPERMLSPDELLALVWPGERTSTSSGRARIYVTINLLRKLGLRDLILTSSEGYRLDPSVTLVRRELRAIAS